MKFIDLIYNSWADNHSSTPEAKEKYNDMRKILSKYIKNYNENYEVQNEIEEIIDIYTAEIQKEAFYEGVYIGFDLYRKMIRKKH